MEDFEMIVCKSCNVLKKRIRAGKRPESKETKFVGEDGLEWNGRKCPQCHSSKVKQTKQLNSELIRLAKKNS